jgi:hypothetical protein
MPSNRPDKPVGSPNRNRRKQRDELIRIGAMMSNLCYNVKQMHQMPEIVRRSAQELQESWDKVRMEMIQ